MPDLTPNYKVPRPLAAGADPLASIDDTARSLAAHLDGALLTNVGALASGWGGTVRYTKYGQLIVVHIDTTKATYGAVETITGPSTFLPAGAIPPVSVYAYGVNPVDGARRGFAVLTSGRVQAYGYEGATGGIVGQVVYIAPPA